MRPKRNPRLLKALAGAMFLVFGAAGLWLLFLAFEIGDVYPPFSSHRAEIDGTAVLYEALERFPELRVARHYGPAGTVARASNTTVIVAGFSMLDWHSGGEGELRELVRLAEGGARLVVTLHPSVALAPLLEQKGREPREKEEKKRARPLGEEVLQVSVKPDSPAQSTMTGGRTVKQAFMVLEAKSERLPERLPWRSGCLLEPRADAWNPIYSAAGRPVLLRRDYGKGEILLLADSFLLTNRAMWEQRYPEFLSWLVGRNREVQFYERHLGVAENPGVAWLIKRYNLDGVVAALLVLAALFVWRNSVPLVPVRGGARDEARVPTITRGSSLLALVSRSLPPSRVLEVCVDEWKKTERPSREVSEQIEKLVHERGDPVAVYRRVVKQISQGPRGFDPTQTAAKISEGQEMKR